MKPFSFVLISPPGGGKGTQKQLITQHFGIPIPSTGDFFRKEIGQSTPLGLKVKKIVESGKGLVDDQTAYDIVRNQIKALQQYGLDGYPRTLAQARMYDKDFNLSMVLFLDVPDEEILKRAVNRRICSKDPNHIFNLIMSPPKVSGICDICGGSLEHRADDRKEKVLGRLKTYHDQTEPILDHYNKKVVRINGLGTPAQVFQRIEEILKRYLSPSHQKAAR